MATTTLRWQKIGNGYSGPFGPCYVAEPCPDTQLVIRTMRRRVGDRGRREYHVRYELSARVGGQTEEIGVRSLLAHAKVDAARWRPGRPLIDVLTDES